MEKTKFAEIFKKAMKQTRALAVNHDDVGNVYEDWFDVEPKLVIRDFDSGDDYPHCDHEFTDLEAAWSYYSNLSRSRVMDAVGTIYECWTGVDAQ